MKRPLFSLHRLLTATLLLLCTGMVFAEQGTPKQESPLKDWMTYYYKNPQPTRFVEEVQKLSLSGMLKNKNAQPPCIAALSQIMAQNPKKIAGWMTALDNLPEEEKNQVLYPAIAYSHTSEGAKFFETKGLKEYQAPSPEILEMEVNSPEVLDMLWGYFLATGKEEPIRRIVSAFNLTPYLGALDKYKTSKKTEEDRKSAYLDVTLKAAIWSLQSNSKQHPRVLEICEALLAKNSLNPVERRGLGMILKPQESMQPKDMKPFSDMPNGKGKDGFNAVLSLTEEEQFFKNWEKPEPPQLSAVRKARRNVPVYTVLLFSDPGVNKDGAADVTADLIVLKPDGGIYIEEKNIVCWKGKYGASAQIIQLAPWHMGIRIEPQDPEGVYTVEVVVRDNVKKIELPLKTTFEVSK